MNSLNDMKRYETPIFVSKIGVHWTTGQQSCRFFDHFSAKYASNRTNQRTHTFLLWQRVQPASTFSQSAFQVRWTKNNKMGWLKIIKWVGLGGIPGTPSATSLAELSWHTEGAKYVDGQVKNTLQKMQCKETAQR